MPGRLQFERAIGGEPGLDAVDRIRIAGARLQHIQPGCRFDGPRDVQRTPAKRFRQFEQDAPHFLGLLLLQRDDVVVDLHRAQRFQIQAGATRRRAVHDSGNAAAMLRLHDEDVTTVPLGDDLVLQVLGRVLAAQVRLEGAAQPRLLAPQAVPYPPQLRARIVHDVAGRVDDRADSGDFTLERRGVGAGLVEQRE